MIKKEEQEAAEKAAEKERERLEAINSSEIDESKTQNVVDEIELEEEEAAKSIGEKYFPYRKNNFMKWADLDFYFMSLIGPYGRIRVLGAVLGVIIITTYAIYGYICYKLCNCLCGGKREDDDEKKNQ